MWSTGSTAGCEVWQLQEGRTCDSAPSHSSGEAVCCWRSFRLRLNMCSTIPHSWSAQDLRSLELMPSGPVAFLALIFWNWFLTWVVLKVRLEQGRCVLEGVEQWGWLWGECCGVEGVVEGGAGAVSSGCRKGGPQHWGLGQGRGKWLIKSIEEHVQGPHVQRVRTYKKVAYALFQVNDQMYQERNDRGNVRCLTPTSGLAYALFYSCWFFGDT